MLAVKAWHSVRLRHLSRLLITASCRRFSSTHDLTPQPLVVSDQITHLKSTFQAYATPIRPISYDSSEHPNVATWMKSHRVPDLLLHIQDVEPRTRRASHAMYAWRFRPGTTVSPSGHSSSMIYSGSANGGEAGAGERLERLLELAYCEDVVLIVFRWYGGVKLGSDRWKCISSVAKEALERGGFLSGRKEEGDHVHGHAYGRKRRK